MYFAPAGAGAPSRLPARLSPLPGRAASRLFSPLTGLFFSLVRCGYDSGVVISCQVWAKPLKGGDAKL